MPNPADQRDLQQDHRDVQQEHRDNRQDRRDVRQDYDGAVSERITGLERWQIAQNGTLAELRASGVRLEDKIEQNSVRHDAKLDKLLMWMLTSMVTVALALGGIVFGLLHK